jgi:hypothetical protein
MGAEAVVAMSPGLLLLPNIVKIREPVLVEALISQRAIEAFDVPVLRGLSWGDEAERHAASLSIVALILLL